MTSDHVLFTSSHFPIESGEDRETNPGIYGKALTLWVAEKLRARGVSVTDIGPEDFGRYVMVRRKPFMLWVACASLDGSTTRWQMFIALERGLLGRFLHGAEAIASLEELRPHFRALVTQVPGVSDIEWQV